MRVLIVTGSSGGHIFPAFALAEELKKTGTDLLLVLPQNVFKIKIPIGLKDVKYLPVVALSSSLSVNNLLGVWIFLRVAWESFRLIIKFKPDVVVGFGGLNTLSLVFWAWLFRIKTIIHEQNVICGKANGLLAKLVDKVAVSFSQTRALLSIRGEKIILTGNPLRSDLIRINKKEALDFFKLKEGKFTVLITGGSQGAHRLNVACFEALTHYPKQIELQIIHICGMQDFAWLAEGYARTNLIYKLFNFFEAMQYAYSLADLIISRAGATTIAELMQFKVPAILVPYPFAEAHQMANAQVLENMGAAKIVLDKNLSAAKISEKLQEYFYDHEKLTMMSQAYQNIQDANATKLLAGEVIRLNNA